MLDLCHLCVCGKHAWTASRTVKLLGQAKGDRQGCEFLLSKRVAKASALIQEIRRYQEANGAFYTATIVRKMDQNYSSWRTVPPSLQLIFVVQADSGRLVSRERTGASLAPAFPPMELALVPRNTRLPLMSQACPLRPNSLDAFGEDASTRDVCVRTQRSSCALPVPVGVDFADESVSSPQKAGAGLHDRGSCLQRAHGLHPGRGSLENSRCDQQQTWGRGMAHVLPQHTPAFSLFTSSFR